MAQVRFRLTGYTCGALTMSCFSFIGANHSCFKACDPKDPNAKNYCQHIYDRIGVQYTCPNTAQKGVFEMCDSENQDFPGIYSINGVTMTYTQPPESLGPITSLPYTARIPSSSNCVTFQSSDLFAQLPTPTGVSTAPTSSSTSGSGSPTNAASGGSSGSAGATRTGSSSANPSVTGTSQNNQNNGAATITSSMVSAIVGVIFSIAFFS